MTREEAINILYGIRADNLNLDDAYTKDKYDALTMAIKALEPELFDDGTLTVNVEDGNKVSRVLVCGENHFGGLYYPEQEAKTGHWIIIDDCEHFIAKCSECGRIEDSRMINKYPYCHCGAKMVEPQESEDKE